MLVQVWRTEGVDQVLKEGNECVRGRQGIAKSHAGLPFVGDKHHALPTSRLITGVPRLGYRVVVEGAQVGHGANKISHLH